MSLEDLLAVFDDLPADEAVARAWRNPSPRAGSWHQLARRDVAALMPLLARALDRLLVDLADRMPSDDERLWADLPVLAAVDCADVSCRCGHLRQRHQAGTGLCRARECRCSRYGCSCAGRRDCAV